MCRNKPITNCERQDPLSLSNICKNIYHRYKIGSLFFVIQKFNYQFFIFIFYVQPGGDTVSRLDKGFTLRSLSDVVDEKTSDVDTEIQNAIAHQLKLNKRTF